MVTPDATSEGSPRMMIIIFLVILKVLSFLSVMWSQKPSEAVSDVVNFKIFLGEHSPRPPSLSLLLLATISPADKKILYKTLRCMVKCTVIIDLLVLYIMWVILSGKTLVGYWVICNTYRKSGKFRC